MSRINLVFLWTVLILSSCAQIQPLSGGEKDVTPARFVEGKVFPKSGSVYFNADKIEMSFNEFIELKNPTENIIITPSIVGKPKYKVVNKKLTIDLSEVEFEPNTTYSFNFNGAIVDFNEGNDSLYQYVFSTGSFLDSLQLSGKLVNSFSNAGEKNISVGLYEGNSDSIFHNTKPKYFTRSDGKGNFNFSFLKPGTYTVAAIDDINKDLIYNEHKNERIGFIKELIVLETSATLPDPLRLFTEVDNRHYISDVNYEYPGKLSIKMNDVFLNEDSIRFIEEDMEIDLLRSNDSIRVYWSNIFGLKKIKLSTSIGENIDTLTRSTKIENDFKIKFLSNINNVINPFDSISLFLNVPLREFDVSKIQFRKKGDTTILDSIEVQEQVLVLKNQLIPASDYEIILNEGLGLSIYDSLNVQDTIRFTTRRIEYYGNLSLKIDIPLEGFVEIVNAKKNVIFKSKKQNEIQVDLLPPGSYSLRFVVDENDNYIWDSGQVIDRIQPEKVIYMEEPITIRSNWDVEMEWKYE